MSPAEPFELGAELAAAGQRETEHRRSHSGVSPLQDVSYTGVETRLWRWVDASADAPVSRFVDLYSSLTPDRRAAARALLSQQDFYTLITFARRTALSSIRTGDGGLLAAAYDALSAIDVDRVDPRDVILAAAVVGHAVQRLGLTAGTLVTGPASRAQPDTAVLLAEMADEQIDLDADWGLREIDLGDGPVLLGSEGEPYAPDADLARMAVSLAGVFEADRYEAPDVTIACDISEVWLNDHQPDGVIGCASVSADLRDEPTPPMMRDTLLAFIAQTQTPAQAAAIAAAADISSLVPAAVLTATSDRLVILLIARAVVQGRPAVEDRNTLMRFDDRLRDLIRP